MNSILYEIFAFMKLDLKNKIEIMNDIIYIELQNGNKIEISANKLA